MSRLEETLLLQIRAVGLPVPEREYLVAPPRRFRWDFCWPDHQLALEVEGGTWLYKTSEAGAHTSGLGVERDCEKQNLAVVAGWRVLRVTTNMVRDGRALRWIEQAFMALNKERGEA